MNTETNEEYWENREFVITSKQKVINFVKKYKFLNGIVTFFYSNRIGDEKFIKYSFSKVNHLCVLDVACGAGKDIIAINSDFLIGVDIAGYPKETARKRGYNELVEYKAPKYEFTISKKVNLITCINLNAHIPFEFFEKILRNALDKLNDGGKIILINEYDNVAPSYSYFSKDPISKNKLVLGMEHYHFENEESFLYKFKLAFPSIKIEERKALFSIVTISQYYAFWFKKKPSLIASKIMFIADAFFGMTNSLYLKFKGNKAEGFLVGYIMGI